MNEIEIILEEWRSEFIDLKKILAEKGAEAHKNEYNLLSAEALRLSMCICDLQFALSVTALPADRGGE